MLSEHATLPPNLLGFTDLEALNPHEPHHFTFLIEASLHSHD